MLADGIKVVFGAPAQHSLRLNTNEGNEGARLVNVGEGRKQTSYHAQVPYEAP